MADFSTDLESKLHAVHSSKTASISLMCAVRPVGCLESCRRPDGIALLTTMLKLLWREVAKSISITPYLQDLNILPQRQRSTWPSQSMTERPIKSYPRSATGSAPAF